MAWSAEKVRLLRLLYRSNWSMAAIALATGQTRPAVINKVYRLRRALAEMELDALHRRLWREDGRDFVGVEQARELLSQSGVRTGLERLTRRGPPAIGRTTLARQEGTKE